MAVPFAVTKSTVTPLAAPPVRDTVSVALHGSARHSVALKTAAENYTTPPASLSTMVRTAVSWAPSVAPP